MFCKYMYILIINWRLSSLYRWCLLLSRSLKGQIIYSAVPVERHAQDNRQDTSP